MDALFQKVRDLCLLSADPQDMPYSLPLLKIMAMMYMTIQFVAWLLSVDAIEALLVTLLDTLVLFLFVALVLQTLNKFNRLVQTMLSLLAVGCVFQLLELPLIYFIEQSQATDTANAEIGLLLVALYGWSLLAFARIFQQALDIRMLSAIVMTLCYVVITLMAIQLVFPNIGQ